MSSEKVDIMRRILALYRGIVLQDYQTFLPVKESGWHFVQHIVEVSNMKNAVTSLHLVSLLSTFMYIYSCSNHK